MLTIKTSSTRMMSRSRWIVAAAALAVGACKPSDILKVAPPAGQAANLTSSQTGSELVYAGERAQIYDAIAGQSNILEWSEVLSDEFTWSDFVYSSYYANMDARRTATAPNSFAEAGDQPLTLLLSGRSGLLLAVDSLRLYPKDQSKVGEGYALVGYAELIMAEDYCAGVPLSQALGGGGVSYGKATTTDSLLNIAIGHFQEALANAGGSDTVQSLASVGMGRAELDLGNYAAAQTAVASVPTGFVYNTQMQPVQNQTPYQTNVYSSQIPYVGQYGSNGACGYMNISDREGGNGLPFLSANDPRLVIDSTITPTCDSTYGNVHGTWYYPMKFGNPSSLIPLATGLEARLISAEADLQSGGPWLADLNALRTDGTPVITGSDTTWDLGSGQVIGQVTGLRPLTDPGSDSARVSLLFSERAFWLFGTGTRLGDMRRLVRQYNRPRESVYPTGSYGSSPAVQHFLQSSGLPLNSYGTDAEMTLPTTPGNYNNAPTNNPNYVGCLTSPGNA